MTCSDILLAACNLISEEAGDRIDNKDFTARAPYVIAAFCGMASLVDKHYRKAFSLGAQPLFNRARIELDAQFPLSDRFIPAAAAYLASMLIAAYNPQLSRTLREDARESFTSAYGEIPATIHGIIDRNR